MINRSKFFHKEKRKKERNIYHNRNITVDETITLHNFSFSRNSLIEELTSDKAVGDCFTFVSASLTLNNSNCISGFFNHHLSSCTAFLSHDNCSVSPVVLIFSLTRTEFSPMLRLTEDPKLSSSVEINWEKIQIYTILDLAVCFAHRFLNLT